MIARANWNRPRASIRVRRRRTAPGFLGEGIARGSDAMMGKQEALKNMHLFEAFEPGKLQALAAAATPESATDGHLFIFRMGEPTP